MGARWLAARSKQASLQEPDFYSGRFRFWGSSRASMLNAPDPTESLRHTVMVGLVTSSAWLAFGLVTRVEGSTGPLHLNRTGLRRAVLTFLVLALAWSWVPPGAPNGAGGVAVPTGTLWEPNFLGSYLAGGAVPNLGYPVCRNFADDAP